MPKIKARNSWILKLTKSEQARLYTAVSRYFQAKWQREDCTVPGILYQVIFEPYKQYFSRFSDEAVKEMKRNKQFKKVYYETRRTLLNFKEKKLISLRKTALGIEIVLTSKGKVEALKGCIRRQSVILPSGKYCYVIFDIPEDVKYVRGVLRYFLKSCNFKYVQKSVWRTNRDVFKLFQSLINDMKCNRWVLVIEGREE
ncbi:MAG: hypothetical protein V1821_01130 [bacterium]